MGRNSVFSSLLRKRKLSSQHDFASSYADVKCNHCVSPIIP
uniref:BLTX704 n=1 Tax=Nephila pilipes TaxID=299642 RepID=A0A076L0U5_NEPPI|nr:BLTX704 [Nephila pilipes]